MVLLSLVFLAAALVLVGVGIVLGLLACTLGGVLLGLGVLGLSILVGLRSGRPAVAVRVFLLQAGVLAGLPAGAILGWFSFALLTPTHSSSGGGGPPWNVAVGGALGGAIAGAMVGLLLDLCLRRLQAWASARRLARVSVSDLP